MLNIESGGRQACTTFAAIILPWRRSRWMLRSCISTYFAGYYINFGLILDGLGWSEIWFNMGKMGKKMVRCND